MSPAASAATAASTRSFSLTTWRTRRSSGVGEARAVARVPQRLDAEQLRRAPALLAALVVARLGEAAGRARVERRPARARRARAARARPRACACRAAGRGPPRRAARRAGRAGRCRRRSSRARSASTGARARPARRLAAGRRRERQDERHAQRGGRRQARLPRQVARRRLERRSRGRPAPARAELRHALRGGTDRPRRGPRATTSPPSRNFAVTVTPSSIGEGQAEAVVVVGVLADQIGASRRESPDPMRVHGRPPYGARARPWTHCGARPPRIGPTFES